MLWVIIVDLEKQNLLKMFVAFNCARIASKNDTKKAQQTSKSNARKKRRFV